jgi:alkanesulfonate monooxygenase SsuD/methylene tetrahydromethanopterin reductase-like flavin-dependent oxidoreductase (luciferase family)
MEPPGSTDWDGGRRKMYRSGSLTASHTRALHYRPMRLGILIPTRGAVMQSARRPPVDECWEMARHADRSGYDAVWVGDSVVAKPRLEPLTTLGYLAGITTRVRLGTAVLLPALRHPVVLAHQIANVDQVSHGRVVLGLGVGWSLPSAEREWAACGADHKRRVSRLEEHVRVWRMLWRGEPVTYRHEDVDLVDHTIGPLPWTAAGPPVLITAGNRGEMLPAQFDRFARLGDGIITTYLHIEECRLVRELAEAALARHGREAADFPICVYTTVRLDDDVTTAERLTTEFLATYYGGGVHQRGVMGLGPAEVVIATLRRYADAGVTDLCIRFVGDDQLAQLERFTAEVLPALAG